MLNHYEYIQTKKTKLIKEEKKYVFFQNIYLHKYYERKERKSLLEE